MKKVISNKSENLNKSMYKWLMLIIIIIIAIVSIILVRHSDKENENEIKEEKKVLYQYNIDDFDYTLEGILVYSEEYTDNKLYLSLNLEDYSCYYNKSIYSLSGNNYISSTSCSFNINEDNVTIKAKVQNLFIPSYDLEHGITTYKDLEVSGVLSEKGKYLTIENHQFTEASYGIFTKKKISSLLYDPSNKSIYTIDGKPMFNNDENYVKEHTLDLSKYTIINKSSSNDNDINSNKEPNNSSNNSNVDNPSSNTDTTYSHEGLLGNTTITESTTVVDESKFEEIPINITFIWLPEKLSGIHVDFSNYNKQPMKYGNVDLKDAIEIHRFTDNELIGHMQIFDLKSQGITQDDACVAYTISDDRISTIVPIYNGKSISYEKYCIGLDEVYYNEGYKQVVGNTGNDANVYKWENNRWNLIDSYSNIEFKTDFGNYSLQKLINYSYSKFKEDKMEELRNKLQQEIDEINEQEEELYKNYEANMDKLLELSTKRNQIYYKMKNENYLIEQIDFSVFKEK